MNEATQQWNKCLEIIKDNISAEQFATWFEPIVARSFEDDLLILKVPSRFFCEKIEELYYNLLTTSVRRVFGPNVRITYKYNVVNNDDTSGVTLPGDDSSAGLRHYLKTNKVQPANPFDHDEYEDIDPQLNPRYTFENYCASTSNRLAVSIAQAIATNPQCHTFSPMFVFGDTGVGKTHLIQAIGIKIKENNPRARVLYVTARVFESQYTTAVRQNKVNDFINFYQSIDVLLMDDIQDLAGKSKTQNTFYHIFNHLDQHQRQLVLSSDRRPSEMDGMEERLNSRFKSGITVELEKPDLALRRQVLDLKAAQDGIALSDEVKDYIAKHVTQSIREIEGVLVSLLAHATMLNRDISLDLTQQVVANSVRVRKHAITFDDIAEAVSSFYHLETDQLYGKSRKREISDARQLLMYFAKTEAQLSSTNIGLRLSRNHATVLHACKQIEQRLSLEKKFQEEVSQIEQQLRSL